MDLVRNPVNSIDRHIGRRIRIRRQMLRMSPAEAAAKLGVPISVLAEYEGGLLRLDVRSLVRMASLLSVRMRFFYDGVATIDDACLQASRRVND